MKCYPLGILFLALVILSAVTGFSTAATPRWTVDKKVTNIVSSDDGSTIVGIGTNMYFIRSNGTITWTDKSYDSVAITPDGDYIIAGGPYAVLFDENGKKVWEIEDTGDTPTTDDPLKVTISRDGDLILTSTSKSFHTWGLSGVLIGGNTTVDITEFDEDFTGAAVTPSGDEILLFTTEGLYSTNRSGYPFRWYDDEEDDKNDWKCRIGILSDDGRNVLCSYDNSLYYGYTSGTLLWNKRIAGGEITDIALSSGKESVIAAGSLDGYVYVVDTNGNVLWQNKLFPYRTDQKITVSISANGSYLTARSLDPKTMQGVIFLFTKKGDLLWTTGGEDAVGTLTRDGSVLLIGTGSDLSSYAVADLAAATVIPTTLVPVTTTLHNTVFPTTATTTLTKTATLTPVATTVPVTSQKAPLPTIVPILAFVGFIVVITGRR